MASVADDEDDALARAAILRRRSMFIASALATLVGQASCGDETRGQATSSATSATVKTAATASVSVTAST